MTEHKKKKNLSSYKSVLLFSTNKSSKSLHCLAKLLNRKSNVRRGNKKIYEKLMNIKFTHIV